MIFQMFVTALAVLYASSDHVLSGSLAAMFSVALNVPFTSATVQFVAYQRHQRAECTCFHP
jgi:hypothetical protein